MINNIFRYKSSRFILNVNSIDIMPVFSLCNLGMNLRCIFHFSTSFFYTQGVVIVVASKKCGIMMAIMHMWREILAEKRDGVA